MKRSMSIRRRRAPGQSLPLIALMIVVLVAMVGLSVDVGNTFSEERQAVAAANAASLAGMNAVIRRGGLDTNVQVYNAIVNSLRSNGIEVAPYGEEPTGNQLRMTASYLDPQGKSLDAMPDVTPLATDIPNNVGFVQVTLDGRVDTFFARVVGRPDLPIDANAYAGQCSLGDGIYPIAVDKSYLNGDQMAKPDPPDANNDGIIDDGWREIKTGDYAGHTARYLYLHDGKTSEPGSFGFLRWKAHSSNNSAPTLEASLRGAGNLSAGFEEAPERSAPRGQLNAPGSEYPSRPGEINEGDWVYGSSGFSVGGQATPIDEHISLGTKMVLPIYNDSIGPGQHEDDNTVRFRVSEFGTFVVLSTGRDKNRPYLELVYLGPARMQSVACQFSAVPVNDSECCELWGDVAFWPEYQIIPTDSQPIQYVVVLDLSGSMVANFNGQCDVSGKTIPTRNPQLVGQPSKFLQCANGPTYTSAVDGSPVPGTTEATGTGTGQYWSVESERRVYVAKQAIKAMIGQLYMPGNAEYDNNPGLYPPDQFGFVYFTDTAGSDRAVKFDGNYFTTNPTKAANTVISTTASGNNPYLTGGGTNAAAGLYRAWDVFSKSPKTVVHTPTGKTYDYKRVVIFITDGVSNQFFQDTGNLRFAQSDSGTYSANSVVKDENGDIIAGSAWEECKNRGGLVIEDARCQTTLYGGVYKKNGVTYERPISQAIDVSNRYLKGNGIDVFALALSSLPDTGLSSGIPSNSSYYRSAADLVRNADGTTNVDQIMIGFQSIIEDGRCQRGLDPAPITSFPATSFRSISLMTGENLSYPNVGQVTISDSVTGQEFSTFIKIDQDGKLRYRFGERIPPGTYSLNATLFYINPRDPAGTNSPARAYGDLWTGAGNEDQISVTVSNRTSAGSLVPSTRANLDLRLSGDVCAIN
jgi:hypothetical protein